jgi:hypothetical protein
LEIVPRNAATAACKYSSCIFDYAAGNRTNAGSCPSATIDADIKVITGLKDIKEREKVGNQIINEFILTDGGMDVFSSDRAVDTMEDTPEKIVLDKKYAVREVPGGTFRRGTVTKINSDKTYDVSFSDGSVGLNIPASSIGVYVDQLSGVDKINVRANQLQSNIEDIKRELMRAGPIMAGMLVYPSLFQYAESSDPSKGVGVYAPVENDLTKTPGGHAVVILGWGEVEETGLKYWIIQNSWGTKWGNAGSFRIRMTEDVDFTFLKKDAGVKENATAPRVLKSVLEFLTCAFDPVLSDKLGSFCAPQPTLCKPLGAIDRTAEPSAEPDCGSADAGADAGASASAGGVFAARSCAGSCGDDSSSSSSGSDDESFYPSLVSKKRMSSSHSDWLRRRSAPSWRDPEQFVQFRFRPWDE